MQDDPDGELADLLVIALKRQFELGEWRRVKPGQVLLAGHGKQRMVCFPGLDIEDHRDRSPAIHRPELLHVIPGALIVPGRLEPPETPLLGQPAPPGKGCAGGRGDGHRAKHTSNPLSLSCFHAERPL
jgi:hypothetical protein